VKILIDPVTKGRLNPLNNFFFKKMFGEKGCEKSVSYLIESVLEDFPFQRKNTVNVNENDNSYKKDSTYNELSGEDIVNCIDLENLVFINQSIIDEIDDEKNPILNIDAETSKFLIHIETQLKE
jgi:hypothetical protein